MSVTCRLFNVEIQNCEYLSSDRYGEFQYPEGASVDSSFYVVARALTDQAGVDKLFENISSLGIAVRIKGLDFSGARLPEIVMIHIFSTNLAKLPSLIELNVSYVPLGHKSISSLCQYFDVKVSGF